MSSTKAIEKTSDKEAVSAPRRDGMRETIESIVVAFIFAFLFRTFEAEAFVIPTGSMAPTLMGRHKDEICPACGFEFTVGASQEINQKTGLFKGKNHRFHEAICPNCRYTLDITKDPVFVGDRILVTKFNYEINTPDRWDVTVFKYPEDPSTNYIKRLCGLPEETIEVRQGDLYRIEEGRAEILRKHGLAKQIAVLQTVYDDDYPPRPMLKAGWPERWAPVAHDGGPNAVAGWSPEADGWQADRAARTYHVKAGEQAEWLRYRHFVPTVEDWDAIATKRLDPEARLILDFLAYDTPEPSESRFFNLGVYWVGDLSFSTTITLDEIRPGAAILFELVEGGRKYRCTLDPNAGVATLSYAGAMDRGADPTAAQQISQAPISLTEPGEYEIRFANIDNRLWLAIDGELVEFPTPAYQPAMGLLVQLPTPGDLTPVGIAARGVTMTAAHLDIQRDIYYRAEFADPIIARINPRQPAYLQEVGSHETEKALHMLADDPDQYASLYRRSVPWFDNEDRRKRWLVLGEDEFLLLGDNSPRSSDSRLWPNSRGAKHRHAVPREALVGKALLIFWPHGLRLGNVKHGQPHGWTIPFLDSFFYHQTVVFGPQGERTLEIVEDYPKYGVPFYPNFERIFRRIR